MARLALLVLMLCTAPWAGAVVVNDLYRAHVSVSDQSLDARAPALKEALRVVLVKVSGTRQVPDHLLQNPERYLATVGYGRSAAGDLELQAEFGSARIEQLLTSAGLPIWSRNRPALMIWIGQSINGQRNLLGEGDDHLYPALHAALKELGIPGLWPILDLEDNIALPVGHLFGLFRDDIRKASARYAGDAILALRVEPVPGGLHASGYLERGQDSAGIDLSATNSEQLASSLAERLLGLLAREYAVTTKPIQPGVALDGQLMRVSGVASYADCQALLGRLGNIAGVNSVRLVAVKGDQAHILLGLTGSWQQVQANLALESHLSALPEAGSYRWL